MQPPSFRSVFASLIALLTVGVVLPRPGEEDPKRPRRLPDAGYVGAEACRNCHLKNHASWYASYHRRMTQVAGPAAILAPFEGTTPAFEGTTWKLEREDERSFVTPCDMNSGAPRGPRQRVVLTTGSHHYQIYWTEDRGEGMTQLPLVWHISDGRWVPRKAMFITPPTTTSGDETGRWQRVCIKCHATNGRRTHPADEHTRVSDFGIACEACHGPGAEHVAFQRDEERPELAADGRDPTIVNPGRLNKERSVEICGQCHGIHPFTDKSQRALWEREGFAYRPGDTLAATRPLLRGRRADNTGGLRDFVERNANALTDRFWPDGEVRISGREYNGLVESACFQRGEMTCLSCHAMHPTATDRRPLAAWANDQLAPGMDGADACLGCHAEYAEQKARQAHTHHATGSSGNECLNCHMPYTTYGLTKAIRSHTITSPRLGDKSRTDKPNACNLCHLDRSLGWTAEHLHDRYGQKEPSLDGDEKRTAAAVLWSLRGDAAHRALMACALGWPPAREVAGTGWMPYLLSTLLMDPYDAVRWIALQTIRLDARYADFELDLTAPIEEQRNRVRANVLTDWLAGGLKASADQRDAVLVDEDGKLDRKRFRRFYAERDLRPVSLLE